MFNFLKKKPALDPVCGMPIVGDKYVAKYGEKFCSEPCVISFEKKNNIDKDKQPAGCCD